MSDNEILKEFLDESQENLDELDRHVVALDQDPSRQDLLASVFRTIHTIKGTSAFLRFSKLEAISHAGETLLGKLRQGELRWGPKSASALLALVDATRSLLANVRASGTEGDAEHAALFRQLAAVSEDSAPPEPIEAPPQAVALAAERATGVGAVEGRLRVDVGLLDRLMNLAGELILARNEIVHLAGNQADPALHRAATHLSALTTQLQHGVMQTRMQPIGNLWGKLPRLVRDLAVACGKQVHLELHGEETELDKALLEAIRDPLTHLLRNAIDHGIEAPEARALAGKQPEGQLALRAFHEGGILIIEVSDDGAGIDAANVQRRARERGLAGGDLTRPLKEDEVMQILFSPGFSTKTSVGRLSGRGVGLDVVKTSIEAIGGGVNAKTRHGHGTTFRISLPLTLAIIPALMVACGEDGYAIPLVGVLELLRFEIGATGRAIESVHGAPVIRLRGKLLPLLALWDELGQAPRDTTLAETISIVVLEAEGRTFGVLVDDIQDAGEIVVRPLPPALKTRGCFAGATIGQDGRVALILDVMAFARRAALLSELREPIPQQPAPDDAPDAREFLVVDGPGDARLAIALEAVLRLVELPVDSVERSGGEEVVQHRGEIVPLVRLSSLLVERREKARTSGGPRPDDSVLHVVVVDSDRGEVGIVVARIVEIVRARLAITRPPSRPGVQCSTVILDRVTELLHLPTLVGPTMSHGEAP